MKIVFCHNVHLRYKTLYDTIKIEKTLYPESHSIVAYNNEEPPEYFNQFDNIEFIKFEGLAHKIGCSNGCITAIKAAIKHDPDVVIFSHDDVFIWEPTIRVFEYNKNNIINGISDVICRIPGKGIYGSNYYMMECFFLSRKAIKLCFEDAKLFNYEFEIPTDIRGSISPEVFLYNTLNKPALKINQLEYEHKLENYNDTLSSYMGFHHLNIGLRGWI